MHIYRALSKYDDLEPWPFTNAESNFKILRGDPRASGRIDERGLGGVCRLGLWRCTAGSFECTKRGDELQTVITGRLRLIRSDGAAEEFGPGDSFFTRKDERVTWDIIEDVTKAFFTCDPDGGL